MDRAEVVAVCCNGVIDLLVGAAVVPGILLLFLMGWSLAVLAGFANVYFQDTKHLCEVGFQIVFYGTPILYELHDGQRVANGVIAYLDGHVDASRVLIQQRPVAPTIPDQEEEQ